MKELYELEKAVMASEIVWNSVRVLGWVGSSSACQYISEDDWWRIVRAGEALAEARTAAMRRAFL